MTRRAGSPPPSSSHHLQYGKCKQNVYFMKLYVVYLKLELFLPHIWHFFFLGKLTLRRGEEGNLHTESRGRRFKISSLPDINLLNQFIFFFSELPGPASKSPWYWLSSSMILGPPNRSHHTSTWQGSMKYILKTDFVENSPPNLSWFSEQIPWHHCSPW